MTKKSILELNVEGDYLKMQINLKHSIIRLLVLLIAFVAAEKRINAKTISFGVYNSDKPTAMLRKFQPIMEYLQKQIEMRGMSEVIKFKIYPSYSKAIDALVSGDCDFTRFGPASYIFAKTQNKGVRLLVMEHKNQQRRFDGVFITQKNSSIESISELKGRTFAFGSELSTIGRYLSQAELAKAGINADDLKRYNYLGRHDKVALVVSVGNYDVGVVKENTYKKLAKSRGLKEIDRFCNVTKPWVVRSGFNDALYDVIQQALLDLNDEQILRNLKQDGFYIARDEDYDFVREGIVFSSEFME